jgi:preprotein translocase subunit SecD
MRRNNLFKTILIVFFLGSAVFTLFPTFNVRPLQNEVDKISQEIGQSVGKPADKVLGVLCGDVQLGSKSVDETLSKEQQEENLKNDLKNRLKNQLGVTGKEKQDQLLPVASRLRQKYEALIKDESKAIKLGLDLQGGTYLVSEVNIPKLIYNLAKNKIDFEPIFNAALAEYKRSDRDFITLISEKLSDAKLPLHRFFGEPGDREVDIRQQLDQEVKDAVDRTLEILRNRIDQFGISEPNIQKQGDNRIIIELAGIKDITRAKNIIGTTAELEFKVVESEKGLEDILLKINRILRESGEGELDPTRIAAGTDSVVTDSTEKVAEDGKVQLGELFKSDQAGEDSAAVDTSSAIVDKNTYKDAPFTSLLRIFRGRGYDIGVAPENVAAVEWILNLDKVKELTKDVVFQWGMESEKIADQQWQRLYLLRRNAELTGKYITNAKVNLGMGGDQGRAGEAEVFMTLNNEGGKVFAQLTERIIGQRLAIVLDGKVSSDPVVQSKIPNGRATIENMGSIDEAKDLALVLRAGALPAPMEFIEERTVGPSLGLDSIQKGTRAALIGMILVVLFMIIYYNYFGLVANLALVLNLVFLMAILSGFGLTLTLPGVAGIILTIGMAVDANVLIFERIREEEQSGKTIRAAIENGYARAFVVIFDSNVTTMLTSLVLFQFGTGPIKGFAVTLFWGIVISMFTSIVITRVIFDFFTARGMLKKIPY